MSASSQSLRGIIRDPQGAVMPGVLVEVADAQGKSWKCWSNSEGRYELSGLHAGPVAVVARAVDFRIVTQNAQVQGSEATTLDLQFTELQPRQTSIEVIAQSTEALQEIPGGVFLVTKEELQQALPMDANEVLRRVPGINLREDSGPVAMRLNIGLRGLNPDRSRTVLMLEDGLPISLAPYGEPEMYYSPPIDRMQRLEVLKGSGQIIHGPQTVGGVLNFVTPEPPPTFHAEGELQGGQRGFFAGQGRVGSSNRDQTFGWLVNALHKRGNGFRDFFFDINDLQGKLNFRPSPKQNLGVKAGWYSETSNSTYLGLTTPMFQSDANQNAVPHDRLRLHRYSGALLHTATLSPRAVLSSSFFAYNTVRNWRRQDFDRADLGRPYLDVVGDSSIAGGAVFLRDSALHRNREFWVYGGQSGIAVEHALGGVRGKLDAGMRYIYEVADDRQLSGASFDASTGALRDDEDRFGKAFSAYAQNRFFLTEKLILTPGLRLEHYRYERHITRQRVAGVPTDVDIRSHDSVTALIPGLGLSWQAHRMMTLFGGVHRGFAPPRVKDAINSSGVSLQLDAELSWNYEAGVRIGPHRAVQGEVLFFRLDFENQIIPAAQSGGATTTLVNGGETLHQGVESSLRVNWDHWTGGRWQLYTDVRHMYLAQADFTRNALFGGNRLPYAPKQTFSVLLGARQRQGFGFQIDASYVGAQFGDNNETVTPSADGTIGPLPSYLLWNLSADYTYRRERVEIRPFVAVKNLTNRTYIASRAPEGIQPGLIRQVNVGLRFSF